MWKEINRFVLQNIQKNFRIVVVLNAPVFVIASPIAPNIKLAINRTKYGILENIPALAKSNFKTCQKKKINKKKQAIV